MTQLRVPNCYLRSCVHFTGVKMHNKDHVDYCKAFPDGIPDDIAYGDNLHEKPLQDQGNDIVYEKKANE
jgi:hypothetical protein